MEYAWFELWVSGIRLVNRDILAKVAEPEVGYCGQSRILKRSSAKGNWSRQALDPCWSVVQRIEQFYHTGATCDLCFARRPCDELRVRYAGVPGVFRKIQWCCQWCYPESVPTHSTYAPGALQR
jgi:hypothetical protein